MKNFQFNNNFGHRRMGIGPGALSPFIKIMLISNLALFIIQNLAPQTTYLLGLSPHRFFVEFPNLLYQPFTYMFLHGGFGHIFFNMFALWMFGTEIEFSWGSKRFGRFYLIAGLAGALLTLMVKSSQTIPMIGASAAVYGVLAAYWVMFPNRKLYIYFLFPVKVKWAIPGFMLIGIIFGGSDTAHFAHLGGAIFGFLYMKSGWSLLSFNKRIKEYKYRRASEKMQKNRKKADEIMSKVDGILDKINEVGIENLSKEEKKILEQASSKLSKKEMHD